MRVCEHPGCITILARLNEGPKCYRHTAGPRTAGYYVYLVDGIVEPDEGGYGWCYGCSKPAAISRGICRDCRFPARPYEPEDQMQGVPAVKEAS